MPVGRAGGGYGPPAVAQSAPAWLPAAGTFADISLNTLSGAKPTGWPTSESAGPFLNWSGAVIAPDQGAYGRLYLHGSGHLPEGNPTWAGVWCFDPETRLWSGRNVPAAALLEGTDYNGYYESTAASTTGHTYPPHTYGGLIYRSIANGGGTRGSLVRNFMAGAGIANPRCVHSFDLSSTTSAASRVLDDVTMGGSSSSYPQAALDEARGGYWLLTYSGAGPLKFVKFSDWSVTNHSGASYSDYGDQFMVYLPSPYDTILCFGRTDAGGVNWSYRASVITTNTPGSFASITVSGTAPPSSQAGGCWSTLLGCVVSYAGNGDYDVYKLTPPSSANVRAGTGTWTWTKETMTGAGGATPTTMGEARSYGRFLELAAARCFLWADSITGPMQAWRLTGM